MSSLHYSFMMRCQSDVTLNITQLQVIRVDDAKTVPLKDGSFLLRITIHEKGTVHCLIRHISSGREVHVQSGKHLVTFIRDCLLDDEEKA